MAYTETQLEAIKIFGRKNPEVGSIIYLIEEDDYDEIIYANDFFFTVNYEGDKEQIGDFDRSETDKYEILGHIPHWHDLFSALRDKGLESFLGSESLLIDPDEKIGKKKNIEVNKYIPLLNQPSLGEIIKLFENS